MSAVERWEHAADEWIELVRSGGDAPYASNSETFLKALPPAGRLTVDVGCGEGRIARALAAAGHRVVGVDTSPTLIGEARAADRSGDYRIADASALPVETGAADLVVSFMALHDIEDARAAIVESARVLAPRGTLALAIIHPVATAGDFEDAEGSRFVLERPYARPATVERPLGAATIVQFHRPLTWYADALAVNRLRIDLLREISTKRRAPDWAPMFLHLHASR